MHWVLRILLQREEKLFIDRNENNRLMKPYTIVYGNPGQRENPQE